MTAVQKKIHIETWGCQMNVADSERILQLMLAANYARAESEHDAQLIVLNTCHIREKAKHKVISRLGRLRQLKQQRADVKIAVVGCVAQAEGQRLRQEVPHIDYILGSAQIEQLPTLVKEQQGSALGFKQTQLSTDTETGPTLSGRFEVSRFINIMQGCNNYCTFCVVPFTRGPEKSQPQQRILAQAQQLLATGVREITLLGQNVNSYGQDLYPDKTNPFVALLTALCALENLQRLRFTTSNPHDFTPALSALFAQQPKLGRYVHLPVQSGSDRILQRMQRKVDTARILAIVAALRQHTADFAISTDVIVGFPGETEEDFEQTLTLLTKMCCSFIFSFKYSPRGKTPARRFRDQVPETVKKHRLARLQQLQRQITEELNAAEVGCQRQVLVHYRSHKEHNVYYGRTVHFRPVRIVASHNIVGQLLPVQITAANATALCGTLG